MKQKYEKICDIIDDLQYHQKGTHVIIKTIDVNNTFNQIQISLALNPDYKLIKVPDSKSVEDFIIEDSTFSTTIIVTRSWEAINSILFSPENENLVELFYQVSYDANVHQPKIEKLVEMSAKLHRHLSYGFLCKLYFYDYIVENEWHWYDDLFDFNRMKSNVNHVIQEEIIRIGSTKPYREKVTKYKELIKLNNNIPQTNDLGGITSCRVFLEKFNEIIGISRQYHIDSLPNKYRYNSFLTRNYDLYGCYSKVIHNEIEKYDYYFQYFEMFCIVRFFINSNKKNDF